MNPALTAQQQARKQQLLNEVAETINNHKTARAQAEAAIAKAQKAAREMRNKAHADPRLLISLRSTLNHRFQPTRRGSPWRVFLASVNLHRYTIIYLVSQKRQNH